METIENSFERKKEYCHFEAATITHTLNLEDVNE